MSRQLVGIIAEQTETLLKNTGIMLHTCDPNDHLYGMPVWKHVYHMLHSLDQWFINPERFDEPSFHVPNLNSLDIPSETILTRQQLENYFSGIQDKIRAYLAELTDEMLPGKPESCPYTRMAMILGQFRHVYAHMGNINGTTMRTTGQWPRVIGLNTGHIPTGQEYFE